MRALAPLLLGSLLVAAPVAEAKPRMSPEAELALAVEGRVAGEPVDCVDLRHVRSTQIIDRTAIIYDTGRTIYVNRPRGGSQSLDQWDTLVTKLHDSRLCSIDIVHLYDAGSRMQSGFVALGEFVPYRKPDRR